MKNLLIPIIAVFAVFMSCSSEPERKGHLITGEIDNANGEEVMMVVFEDQTERVLDTVLIENGKFEIETDTKELRQYILLIGENEMPVILFLDENSDDVTIKGSLPGIGENYSITGSEESQHIKDYLTFLKPHFETEQNIYMEMKAVGPYDTTTIQGYMTKLDSISAIQRDYAIAHIDENPGSPSSWMMLRELFPASGLINFDTTDINYFKVVADGIRDRYPYSEYPDLIEKDIESVRAQIEQMNNPELSKARGTANFEYAPEINLNSPDGNPIALSSLKGKVVLVDFWASWCKPCRMENPNVVKMYDQYKDKGFTIYSVSLDEKRDDWVRAIEADNLKWPNHVSDLQGWRSSAAAAYNVQSIPATFLLDADGKVIGTNLRGPQLEQKLQEVLG